MLQVTTTITTNSDSPVWHVLEDSHQVNVINEQADHALLFGMCLTIVIKSMSSMSRLIMLG